ncbi:chitin-binding domain-containing protein [Palleronia abyssalis]|uniref:Chitin-binding type-2 domain-containing protein n=1 Tax=Palleronia abyssalis TaxID=1501240 RepID=A0A2R8C1D4_9RHOB|nr:chitin-binding domain-containing protein [Palleronia abyssalis]SPJ26228.1 hypothetical protein PAA8504_04085 [Palleronia abyssalis]
MKTLLTAFILAAAPLSAFADCSWSKQTAMSCADGTTYDSDTQNCVPVTG